MLYGTSSVMFPSLTNHLICYSHVDCTQAAGSEWNKFEGLGSGSGVQDLSRM